MPGGQQPSTTSKTRTKSRTGAGLVFHDPAQRRNEAVPVIFLHQGREQAIQKPVLSLRSSQMQRQIEWYACRDAMLHKTQQAHVFEMLGAAHQA